MAVAGINLAGTGQALDTSLPTIYSEFKLLRDETGVCRKVSTKINLPPHSGRSKNVLNYGRLSMYDLEDGVDMVQAQTLADTNTVYSPSEVGGQVVIPKTTLRRVADPDLLKRTGRMMANAYDLKEDADGCAQFTSWVPLVGSAGTVISPGLFSAARARLRIGNDRTNPEPAPAPWFAVLHPLHLHVLAGRTIPLSDVPAGTTAFGANTGAHAGVTVGPGGGGSFADELLRKGPDAMMKFFGVEIFEDANIAVDSSDDASGAMFSKEGFYYIEELAPKMEAEFDDPSLRALELNLVGSYTWGLYRASNMGVEILADASLPTS